MIVIDIYEPEEIKAKLNGRVEKLGVGDYHITGERGSVAIERKTVDDFVSSIRDGRLWEQLALLKHLVDYQPLLLLEGETWRVFKFRKVTLPQWYSMIQSVIIGFGIPVVQVRNSSETVAFIQVLHKRLGVSKSYSKPVIKKKRRDLLEQAEDVLTAFDHIGREKAKCILQQYSLRDIVLNPSLLYNVRGVGEKIVQNFVDVINAKKRK